MWLSERLPSWRLAGDWEVAISQQCATTAVCIATSNQPPGVEAAGKYNSVTAAPLLVMVGITQLQLSVWEDERRRHSNDTWQASLLQSF
jgi:hypothetical protein